MQAVGREHDGLRGPFTRVSGASHRDGGHHVGNDVSEWLVRVDHARTEVSVALLQAAEHATGQMRGRRAAQDFECRPT